MFLVIPAIDLRGGRCVRLFQGRYDRETTYGTDPVAMALTWQRQKARVLHVVDLDAALGGSTENREIIGRICQALDIPVQVGGGMRTMADIQLVLELGAERVILGTAAVRNPALVEAAIARFSDRQVVVGIDAQHGEVRIQGWTEGGGINALDFALEMQQRGVRRLVYTDISRDGTMDGPNIEGYRAMGRHLQDVRITASGGVGSQADLVALAGLQESGVDSAIVGRALYEGRFSFQQALDAF